MLRLVVQHPLNGGLMEVSMFSLMQFLGVFAKLRKATFNFVVTVRLTSRPYGTTPSPTERIFMKIYS